jgi:hypothetical protein
MSAETAPVEPSPPPLRSFVRLEYRGFEAVPDHREYRLAVCGPEGPTEVRFRIALAAFGAGRVRLQDGPDVCYQKLLEAVAAGGTVGADVVTIDDAELASYREAHTPVPRHRLSVASSGQPPSPLLVAAPQPKPRPRRSGAALPATIEPEPGLDEGQRVRHAVFGAGVTASSGGGRTVVRFDEDGPRTFVTSLLQLEVLSGPHTWETGPRGKNRPRETALAPR